ncbi:hypothetical protein AKO1_008940 [Acrasis kona]|uniref:Gustatory receptor n=1 Tax=Acrasis kona TaxID=1008807 RepID=A0AAW2ZH94_9EUKA
MLGILCFLIFWTCFIIYYASSDTNTLAVFTSIMHVVVQICTTVLFASWLERYFQLSLPFKILTEKQGIYLNNNIKKLTIVKNLFSTLSVLLKYGGTSITTVLGLVYIISVGLKTRLSSLTADTLTTLVISTFTCLSIFVVIISFFILILGGVFRPSSMLYFNRNLKRKSHTTRTVFDRLHRTYSNSIHRTTFVNETRLIIVLSITQIVLGIPMVMFLHDQLCPFINKINFEVRLWELHTFICSLLLLVHVSTTTRYYDAKILMKESDISSMAPRSSHVDGLMTQNY